MFFLKSSTQAVAVEINAPDYALKHGQGHAQKGTHLRCRQALDFFQITATRNIAAQDRNPLLQHLAGDRAADLDQLGPPRLPHPCERGIELLAFLVSQQDRAPAGGNHLKNQVQQLPLQVVEIANRVYDPADLEQGVQVARHARGGGQLAQEALRLQVDYVPRVDDRSFRRGLCVL